MAQHESPKPAPVKSSVSDSGTLKPPERLKGRVQRHSPDRLLRKPVVVRGDVTVSAEKHRGRLVVRVESRDDER